MQLSAFTVLFKDKPLAQVLDIFKSKGIMVAEVGAGGFIGKDHCDPALLLRDASALDSFRELFESPRHADRLPELSRQPAAPAEEPGGELSPGHQRRHRPGFCSGCGTHRDLFRLPGDSDSALYPSWPASPFPEELQAVSAWQWEKKLLPYWREMGRYAADKGVKVAMEMHGGYSVHSPATMIRMRRETGCEALGANLDPSHLWWQGIDPAQAARYLGKEGCLFYMHAKDAALDPQYISYYGVTDMQSFGVAYGRAWQFRTVGFGHDLKTWADLFDALRSAGYDDVVSIEHEDSHMSVEEGLDKAVANLRQVLPVEAGAKPKAFEIEARFKAGGA